MIPHTFHFVWVGPNPIPPTLLTNVEGWRRLNPTWHITLWSDTVTGAGPWDDIRWEPVINRRLYDHISLFVGDAAQWAGRSDIVRLEVLAKHGGVYLDFDVKPLKPVDTLFDTVTLCLADERAQEDTLGRPGACNGNYLIGARPNHPALWTSVREIEGNMVRFKGDIIKGTGPQYVFRQLVRHPDCVVFPHHLFNPCRPRVDWSQVTEWPPTAYANHCFHGTWYGQTKTPPTPDL